MKASPRNKVVWLSRWKQYQRTAREIESMLMRLFPAEQRDEQKDVVTVRPTRRFRKGKGVVAVLIPCGDFPARGIKKVLETVPHHPEEPGLIESYGQWSLLAVFPCPEVEADGYDKLLAHARKLARWAEEKFDMKSMISPLANPRAVRMKLGVRLRWKS